MSYPLPPSLANEKDSPKLPPFFAHHKCSRSPDEVNIESSKCVMPPGPQLNQEPVVGVSSNAVQQRQIRSTVFSGTWELDQVKWDRFLKKVLELNPNAILDPKKPLHVLHSCCKNWVAIDLPYDFHSFEHHCSKNACQSSKKEATVQVATLASFGFKCVGPSMTSSPSMKLATCIGLSGKDDHRILLMLAHCPLNSGGGHRLLTIAQERFGAKYCTLSDAQKDLITEEQTLGHTW